MRPRFSIALAAVLLASPLALVGCDSGSSDSDAEVQASGTVTNSFGRPVQGSTVTFAEAGSGSGERSRPFTATTNAEGRFSLEIPEGVYNVTIAVLGYVTETFTATVEGDGSVTVQTPQISGEGNINVNVTNAIIGLVREGAVECRRQLSADTYSGVELVASTDAQGRLSVEGAFTGEAQCTVRDGALTIPFDLTITTNTTGEVVATPPPPAGALRVVLTWGENPSDLDSHLTGPDGQGGRFHVYYSNQSANGSSLDLDDVTSYGPETITLVPQAVGTYRYSVHNFTTQSNAGAQGIFTSPAVVRVFNSDGQECSFKAPAPTAANGGIDADTWRVFEVEATRQGALLTLASPCTPGETELPGGAYFQAASSSDTSVFRTGGRKTAMPLLQF